MEISYVSNINIHVITIKKSKKVLHVPANLVLQLGVTWFSLAGVFRFICRTAALALVWCLRHPNNPDDTSNGL